MQHTHRQSDIYITCYIINTIHIYRLTGLDTPGHYIAIHDLIISTHHVQEEEEIFIAEGIQTSELQTNRMGELLFQIGITLANVQRVADIINRLQLLGSRLIGVRHIIDR